MVFRKNSPHLQLNPAQLASAAAQLRLKLDNSGPCDTATFYRNIKSITGNYPLNSLVLTAFFLCFGSAEEKAKVLFELYDERNAETLDAVKIGTMVSDLFDIACVHLPIIAHGPQVSAADRPALRIYLAKINFMKESFMRRFAEFFLKSGTRVSKKDFILTFVKEWPAKLITSYGFRSTVFNDFANSSETVRLEFDRTFKRDNRLSSYMSHVVVLPLSWYRAGSFKRSIFVGLSSRNLIERVLALLEVFPRFCLSSLSRRHCLPMHLESTIKISKGMYRRL